jgi:hypothetical protein
MRHLASRGVLAVLGGFIAVTAISGALFVVPTLPLEWIEGTILPDYTLPALALFAVGVVAAVACLAVVVRPDVAGAIGIATGLAMITFELVQIAIVGFSLVEYGADQPYAWLQVVYLAVGALTAGTGFALWRATGEDRVRRSRTRPMARPVHP